MSNSVALNQRIITAIILIPLVLLVIYQPFLWVFNGLLLLMMMQAWREWVPMVTCHSASTTTLLVPAVILFGLMLLQTLVPGFTFLVLLISLFLVSWIVVWVSICKFSSKIYQPLSALSLLVFGAMLLAVFALSLSYLKSWQLVNVDGVSHELLLVLLVVWSADSGAFFVGRSCGRNRLCPVLSPGKTWEGVLGGIGLAMLVYLGAAFLLNFPISVMMATLVFIVAIVSVFGDLFESLIKRHAGVKDSGNLLPGHGGVLDRIDGLLVAVPVFAAGYYWLH